MSIRRNRSGLADTVLEEWEEAELGWRDVKEEAGGLWVAESVARAKY
jgi:hypothetical protein